MPTIDADAHVIESDETWLYIPNEKLRPFLISPGAGRPQNWLIDGRVFNRGGKILKTSRRHYSALRKRRMKVATTFSTGWREDLKFPCRGIAFGRGTFCPGNLRAVP